MADQPRTSTPELAVVRHISRGVADMEDLNTSTPRKRSVVDEEVGKVPHAPPAHPGEPRGLEEERSTERWHPGQLLEGRFGCLEEAIRVLGTVFRNEAVVADEILVGPGCAADA
jgi:hypothetical protein